VFIYDPDLDDDDPLLTLDPGLRQASKIHSTPASMAAVECPSDGTGCQTLFTFVIGDSNGALQLSDFETYVAGLIANGSCSGLIATLSN
jgi:hypothetical protein